MRELLKENFCSIVKHALDRPRAQDLDFLKDQQGPFEGGRTWWRQAMESTCHSSNHCGFRKLLTTLIIIISMSMWRGKRARPSSTHFACFANRSPDSTSMRSSS